MRFGKYDATLMKTEEIDQYMIDRRFSTRAKAHVVKVQGPKGGQWMIRVILPMDSTLRGVACIHTTDTLQGPFSQIASKSMTINPIAEGYISELKRCRLDGSRVRCHQIRVEDPYPKAFVDSGVRSVEYSKYRQSSKSNYARGWLFKPDDVEKMALCYYLGRIEPFL